jgi:acyl-coenzyme A synthetase/AMP-(fatty) acid ligase
LFLSPKNSTEGALAVLEATKCNIWVNACEITPVPLVKEILQKRPMNVLQLPLLDELLDAMSTEAFAYTKTFDEAINDPFCFLHTSGTTGVPKPIPWSHGLIGTMDAVRLLQPAAGDGDLPPWTTDWKTGDTIYSSFPMSHVRKSNIFLAEVMDREKVYWLTAWIGCRYYYGYSDARPF